MALSLATRDNKRHQIAELCRRAVDARELLDRLREPLRAVVPFDAGFLSSTDPATTLFASDAVVENLPEWACAPWFDNEFLVDDFNKFIDLHRSRSRPTTLHRATFDRLARSARHREINSQTGFGPELRATFALADACWGTMNLLREAGAPDFTDDDLTFVDEVSTIIAEGLRRAVLDSSVLPEDPHIVPGVILLDAAGVVTAMTDRSAELMSELGQDMVQTGFGVALPGEAYIVGARARARALGRPGPDPVARVRARSGMWLTLRADCTRDSGGEIISTALVIEPSRTSEVLPLFVAAHGLSGREEEVLAQLVNGRSTAEIAEALFISSHTIRDHVKSILEKVGVSSRGELVSKLFSLHYQPGFDVLHDR